MNKPTSQTISDQSQFTHVVRSAHVHWSLHLVGVVVQACGIFPEVVASFSRIQFLVFPLETFQDNNGLEKCFPDMIQGCLRYR